MQPPLIIDGVRCEDEQAVRDYAFNYVKQGFKQDFRLAAGAYKLPFIQLVELLDTTGHEIMQAGI